MPHIFRSFLTFPIVLFLAACGSYDFTINEKLVYTPKPLFSDYTATDTALQSCLEQAVAEAKATRAADLEILNCAHAGITDLEGLEVFSGISRLKLSSNALTSIAPLAALSNLEVLHLDNNQIVDLRPLLELQVLRELNLSDNSDLLCSSAAGLIAIETVTLPKHCL
ncbi:MAG: Leucine-rich repeat (LRR) protein [Halioglobus sp.]|jgi:Leucine-rich repeat (LRR) protein